jgi:cbb3-type cytochrome oxidase subunit 3
MLARLADHIHLLQYAHILWGLAVFAGLAAWAYWPSRKNSMSAHAARILEHDDNVE